MFRDRNNELLTESVFARDKNKGLYSLASRLGVDFKGVYPDDLKWKIVRETEFAKKVKCSLRNKMPCRCRLLSNTHYALVHKRTQKQAWGCFHCVKELVYNEHRTKMYYYECLHFDKPMGGNIMSAEQWEKSKPKYKADIARYFNVIDETERRVLDNDGDCNTEWKSELAFKIERFIKVGNGYEEPKGGANIDDDLLMN